jgi:hypothetical protein
LQNVASAISITGTGDRFAVGFWGDGDGPFPEVQVYRRDQNAPYFTASLTGSVHALEISADGRRLAVAQKITHANISGGGGAIRLYRLQEEDFVAGGIARQGAMLHFDYAGNPNSPVKLLRSSALDNPPTSFPGIGTLYIYRAGISHSPLGTTGPEGLATGTWQVPPTTPVGTKLFFQAFGSSPRALSETWIPMLVVP